MSSQKKLVFCLCALAGLSMLSCDEESNGGKADVAGKTCYDNGDCNPGDGAMTALCEKAEATKEAAGKCIEIPFKVCEAGYDCNVASEKCEAAAWSAEPAVDKYCMPKDPCNNGEKDDKWFGESDVDCGGTCGATCVVGKCCNTKEDCVDGLDCSGGKCATKTCSGDAECGDGYKCNKTSKSCEEIKPDISALMVNEFGDSGKASPAFSLNGDVAACEFIEIANTSESTARLTGVTLNIVRTDKEGTEIAIPLSGILQSKNVLVIHNCESLPLPEGAIEMKGTKLAFTQNATYSISFSSGSAESEPIETAGMNVAYSYNRAVDYDATKEFGKSTELGAVAAATPGYCMNGGVYVKGCAEPADTCSSGAKDGDETDVDCGGKCGATCGKGKACNSEKDCATGACSAEKVCVDKGCTQASDCGDASEWTCDGGSCKAVVAADPDSLIINEVYNSSSTVAFDEKLYGGTKGCEFVEIANPTAQSINLSGLSLNVNRTDSGKESAHAIKLSGELSSKHLLVVNNCVVAGNPEIALPEDAHSFDVAADNINKDAKGFITAGGAYDVYLSNASKNGLILTYVEGSNSAFSYNRSPDFDATKDLEPTTEIGGHVANMTPGYCINGGLYSQGCKVDCGNGLSCGGICAPCEAGEKCTENSDCKSNVCKGDVCEAIVEVDPDSLIINEIYNSASKKYFELNGGLQACEFVEIANPTAKTINLSDLVLNVNRVDAGKESAHAIKLSGELPSKHLLIVNNCVTAGAPEIVLPEDAHSFGVTTDNINKDAKGFITNGGVYDVYLSTSSKDGTKVTFTEGSGNVFSYNRSTDFDASTDLVSTTEIEGYAAKMTPGYCVNGGLYSQGCVKN